MRSLRRDHPNFWLVAAASSVTLSWIGVGYLLIPQRSESFRVVASILPIRAWGAIWLAAGLLIGCGMLGKVRLFRAGLSFGAAVAIVFHLGFLAVVVEDLVSTGGVAGSGAPALYGFLAACLIAQAREPRTNPDAARGR